MYRKGTKVIQHYSDFLLVEGFLGLVAVLLAVGEVFVEAAPVPHHHDVRVLRGRDLELFAVDRAIVEIGLCDLGLVGFLVLDKRGVTFARHDLNFEDVSVNAEEVEESTGGERGWEVIDKHNWGLPVEVVRGGGVSSS